MPNSRTARSRLPPDLQRPDAGACATRRLLDDSEHASFADQFRREIEVQAEIRDSATRRKAALRFWRSVQRAFTGA